MWRNILFLAGLRFYVNSIDTDPFDPTKFEVIYKNLAEENELEVSETLIFKCEVSHEYEWCGFFHENCIIKPNETNCTYENIGRGRANVIEDPDKKFCQLTLANLSKIDDGNWTCKFKREHSIDNSDIANDFILLHIKYNLTSITSPITTVPTTKTTDRATTTYEAITFEENRTSIVDENYNYSTVAIIIENSTSTSTITISKELIPFKDTTTAYDEPDEKGSGSNCNDGIINDNGICEIEEPDEGSGDSCDDEDSEGCVNKRIIRKSTTTFSSTTTISTSTTTTTTTKATTTTKTSTTSTHQTTTATQINASSTTITTTPIRTTSSFTSPTPIDSIFPDNTQCSKIHKKVQKNFEISFHKILQNSTL